MITLGIDLSSMPKGTAACSIAWSKKRAIAAPPVIACSDDEPDTLISNSDVIGIDAPFGWPEDFVNAVADWTANAWSSEGRDRFQFREPDREMRKHVGRWPPLPIASTGCRGFNTHSSR
jgi:predicted nuclease with RNAse H fold